MATSPFSARLDSGLVERLRQLGAREGVTSSQLAERFIQRHEPQARANLARSLARL